jgi:hypothetical protein
LVHILNLILCFAKARRKKKIRKNGTKTIYHYRKYSRRS